MYSSTSSVYNRVVRVLRLRASVEEESRSASGADVNTDPCRRERATEPCECKNATEPRTAAGAEDWARAGGRESIRARERDAACGDHEAEAGAGYKRGVRRGAVGTLSRSFTRHGTPRIALSRSYARARSVVRGRREAAEAEAEAREWEAEAREREGERKGWREVCGKGGKWDYAAALSSLNSIVSIVLPPSPLTTRQRYFALQLVTQISSQLSLPAVLFLWRLRYRANLGLSLGRAASCGYLRTRPNLAHPTRTILARL
ncbi:hypothetical protein DFH09DRAFT_1455012 [Mycena vulgaris]|nr:hypothetical protein DFH09DRAFT_1455012 [Mycena vulgaris]